MYADIKKCLLLIRRCGKYLCFKYEKMSKDAQIRMWNNIKQRINPDKI